MSAPVFPVSTSGRQLIKMISRMKKTLWFPLVALALCALALWTVQGVGLTVVQVRGPSMVPSYTDGQVLFVNRLAYGLQGPIIGRYLWIWKAPEKGDPVVVQRPDADLWVVKRVAGLPGTPLTVQNHQLTVGNRTVSLTPAQEYWLAACPQVPAGTVFVLGDNLDRSLDSRDWGFVPVTDVLGRAFF
jgi:signal peptidase I